MTGIRSWTVEVTRKGSCCQNGAGSYPLSLGVLPPVPQPSEREQLAFIHFEAEWLLRCAFSRPFVEPVCWNQKPTKSQRIAEGRLCGCCLRPCVDRARRDGRVLCPMCNQTPLHQRKLPDWFLWILADHGNRLRGRNVEARRPVVILRIAVEVFLNDLLPPR